MPLPMVLKQIDLLGSEVVPVLRQELAAKREPEVAEAPPTPAGSRPSTGTPRRGSRVRTPTGATT